MSSRFQNQQNNWAYVLLIAVIMAAATFGILNYTKNTIEEINSLSEQQDAVDF